MSPRISRSDLISGTPASRWSSAHLEPLEGKIHLASEGMHFGDLVGHFPSVLALEGRQRRVGLAAPPERVKCERQSKEPPGLVRFLFYLLQGGVGLAL